MRQAAERTRDAAEARAIEERVAREQERQTAQRAIAAERAARQSAETRAAALQAELDRLRAQQPPPQ